jgi:signal transduction histidine kinase
VMRQLFKPFFTTKPKGSGLGLTISRQIIEDHHGELRIESEPGKGTECVISLPAA